MHHCTIADLYWPIQAIKVQTEERIVMSTITLDPAALLDLTDAQLDSLVADCLKSVSATLSVKREPLITPNTPIPRFTDKVPGALCWSCQARLADDNQRCRQCDRPTCDQCGACSPRCGDEVTP